MNRFLKHAVRLFLLALFSVLIILFPSVCIKSASDGFEICIKTILPSLFPFMVVSKYLIYSGYGNKFSPCFSLLGKLFRLPDSSGLAFFTGAVCGSPVGASSVCDMVEKGQLSKRQAEHLLGFCNNTGPLFLIGTVGSILFSDKKTGYFLYSVHIISALLTGILLRFNAPQEKRISPVFLSKENSPFVASVNDSVSSMLGIFGFIITFSVICGFFNAFSPVKNDILNAVFCGFLEISCGCIYISALHLPIAAKMCLISLVCGFSGLCILFQTIHITKKTGLDIRPCLKAKLLFSVIALFICFTFCLLDVSFF